jgi:poly(A) polymerase
VSQLAALDAQQPPLPTGIGDAIMQAFGLPPSRKVGDLKRALEQAVEAGEIQARLESADYVAFLREQRERFGL